ncbi:hypothetical protein VL2_gp127 [Pseudomonas phage vB_PaeM_VL12]|nr:hypothetical protein [Pseudomonas aeruginosa]YP_008856909.1 hypothetical protein X832_gp033 [Pseudomonas phage PAK_P5]YP_008857667.1 hypothetical protein PAK_P30032 [Pseudomonas phage PAK_P3]YP_008858055.1 hypothetical protein X837_gp032 [Pseudomonas phage CHA_P1]YP_009124484.1 hypothetical protein VC54_gp123 [Pseudomonas phage vB_PaeM_PAO1_Ab03]YP_009604709.1 hypothetical protein FDH93_gp082 [Pseudomonas phage vB_PaeM_G1]ADX32034.1 hypothetical protein P3_CHA0032 [Pseudomonas phage P3_CHA
MAAARSNNEDSQWKYVLDLAAKFLLPLLMAWATWQQTQIGKVEDRLYALQAVAVTEQKLVATESRILNYLDVRLGDLDKKMEVNQKYSEMIIQMMKQER